MFQSFSKQWLHAQLTHNVSLSAAKTFWKLSLHHVGELLAKKKEENITRKIPQFPQVRKNIYKDICPEVEMTVAFRDKNDNSMVFVMDNEPQLITQYQRDPRYQKLYEEAHIKVICAVIA